MTRDDVIRMARGAGLYQKSETYDAYGAELERFAHAAYATGAAAERNRIAAWMMAKGYATGHGDTVEDLLTELEWQVKEREREACAEVCEKQYIADGSPEDVASIQCAAAIRERGQA